MKDNLPKFTLEEYAEFVKENKPYLVRIEDEITKIEGGYGTVEVRLEVRAGVVNKMSFWRGETWLQPNQNNRE